MDELWKLHEGVFGRGIGRNQISFLGGLPFEKELNWEPGQRRIGQARGDRDLALNMHDEKIGRGLELIEPDESTAGGDRGIQARERGASQVSESQDRGD